MTTVSAAHALSVERSSTLLASVLSDGRRSGVRLVSGDNRAFGLNEARSIVHVPYPGLCSDWTTRTLTCGIALQCAPSKDRVAAYVSRDLTARECKALAIVEAEVALGWIARRWPGLSADLQRHLPGLTVANAELDGPHMLERAWTLARSDRELPSYWLLGQWPRDTDVQSALVSALRRMVGRMPWSERRRIFAPRFDSIPVGGDGGVHNPNLPPPSRPDDEEREVDDQKRLGVPYPEWNVWTDTFLRNHVAVLERKHTAASRGVAPRATALHRFFQRRTHRAMRNRLEDGSEFDVDSFIEHHLDKLLGDATEARVFRDLVPSVRDVTTALLLDGSSSLGAKHGSIFQLELASADALCDAMALARERHGLFVFSGNTRHRIDVTCLKDFGDACRVTPSALGLSTGGYTRLGAPLRHLTRRLLDQPSERRLLIVLGDGLISDDGYEGHYAWADSAHAVEEAENAGVVLYYIGVGHVRVDPLPSVFGPRRSTRIKRVDELPRVLASVHRQLVAA